MTFSNTSLQIAVNNISTGAYLFSLTFHNFFPFDIYTYAEQLGVLHLFCDALIT